MGGSTPEFTQQAHLGHDNVVFDSYTVSLASVILAILSLIYQVELNV